MKDSASWTNDSSLIHPVSSISVTLALALPLPLAGPQRAAIRVAQVEGLAGGGVGDLPGLELTVGRIKAEDGQAIAGGECNPLLAGVTYPPQPQIQPASFGGVNRQCLLAVKSYHRSLEGNPGVLDLLALPLTIALTATLSLTVPAPLTLTLSLTLASTLMAAALALCLAAGPLRQAKITGPAGRVVKANRYCA